MWDQSGRYKKQAAEEFVISQLESRANRDYLEQQFGTETMQRMMTDDGEIAYYLRHGHTDIKKMAAAHEMIQSPEAPEITGAKQAEALLQLHNMTGNVNGLKQKDKKEWIATISEQARKNGIANPDAFAEARMRELEEFSKKNK